MNNHLKDAEYFFAQLKRLEEETQLTLVGATFGRLSIVDLEDIRPYPGLLYLALQVQKQGGLKMLPDVGDRRKKEEKEDVGHG